MKGSVHTVELSVHPCIWPPDLVNVDWDCGLMQESLACYDTRKYWEVLFFCDSDKKIFAVIAKGYDASNLTNIVG